MLCEFKPIAGTAETKLKSIEGDACELGGDFHLKKGGGGGGLGAAHDFASHL
jgi:hypothetical protein